MQRTAYILWMVIVSISCKKEVAAPVLDNKYDEASSAYVPTPNLNTAPISGILALSAISGGTFENDYGKPVTAKGVCWGLTENPNVSGSCTNDGPNTTSFTSNLTGLLPDTLYYVRAYATNEAGTIYGGQRSFRTKDGIATFGEVKTMSVLAKSATLWMVVTGDGTAPITRKGFVWAEMATPTLGDSVASFGAGIGSATRALANLKPGTEYRMRAFTESAARVTYSTPVIFTTQSGQPQFSGLGVSAVTSSGSLISVTIDSDGGDAITARGVCYSTQPDPTIAGTCVYSGSGTGSYSVSLTGLEKATAYFIRPYATNSVMTGYGAQASFVTSAVLPTVTTGAVSGVTSNSATVPGEVTDSGGATVTVRGVCYSTTQSPTLSGTCVAVGSGEGAFLATITGLSAGTTYFVRAYATNIAGTAYGSNVQFTTAPGLPIVITGSVSAISGTGATVAGDVTAAGGTTVTARGVCYATTQNPTTSGTCLASGSGMGTFSATLTALIPATIYYVRAYASNSAGTSYGSNVQFTTAPSLPTVITGSVSAISGTGATVVGNVTATGGATVIARGVCYATTQNPTTANSCVVSGTGAGAFEAALTALSAGVTYFVRAYATNSAGTAYGAQISFMTNGSTTDIDGNVYPTVQIGTQVWMAANLRTTRYRTGATITNVTNATTWGNQTTGAWAHYNNNTANETVYGKLYNWYAVADSRNICPTGWHVPSDAEWTVLSNFLATDAGFKMKATSGWSTGNGSNESGFNGLPGGSRDGGGTYWDLGQSGNFWSSSQDGISSAWYRILNRDTRNLVRWSFGTNGGFSVRCLRD